MSKISTVLGRGTVVETRIRVIYREKLSYSVIVSVSIRASIFLVSSALFVSFITVVIGCGSFQTCFVIGVLMTHPLEALTAISEIRHNDRRFHQCREPTRVL
uniref:Uncharacterized protein n=1 Tax=Daphnia magna TaxID=35525 RepID=A0A0P5PWN6_9CRUS